MKTFKVEVSDFLISELFRTGYTIDKTVVSEGLPLDAKFIYAESTHGDSYMFYFESEKSEGPEEQVSITLTTIRDA